VNIETENILKQVTVRIKCNQETGSGVLFFPENNPEFIYVFTAKHCLCGKDFNKPFKNTDIKVDKIFKQSTEAFSEYNCLNEDVVIQTDNEDDVALIIIKKQAIESHLGDPLVYKLIDKNNDKQPVYFRGFPQFTQNEQDRPFEAKFVEEIKSHTQKFQLNSLDKLDSFYTPSADNMAGTSGSGLFVIRENIPYLLGILTDIDKVDSFSGTKIAVLNDWLNAKKLPALNFDSQQEVSLKNDVDIYIKETVAKMAQQFMPGEQLKTINDFDLSTGITFPSLKTLSSRDNVVQQCHVYLQSTGCLWVHGDVGIGKTHLAYLIALNNSNHFWLDFSDFEATTFFQYLLRSFCNSLGIQPSTDFVKTIDLIYERIPDQSIVVLNDLPELTGQTSVQNALNTFLLKGTAKSIKFIVTSNYLPVTTMVDLLGDNLVEYPIPMFGDEECKQVLIAYGATDDLDNIARTVVLLTDGHPLIINAVCRYLKEKSWVIDRVTLNSLFKNDYGKQLDKETYERLLASTEDEDSRQLLYRCKLIIGAFSDRELQVVSNVDPIIDNLNLKVIRLTGLWLKTVQEGKYQLSALIKRLGQNFSQQLSELINQALGDDILLKSSLNPNDALKALQYFDRAKAYNQATLLLVKVLTSSMENPKLFYDWGFALYWYFEALPAPIHPFAKLYIRFLQINLALIENKETDFLIADLNRIAANEDVGESGKGIVSLLNFRLNADKDPVGALSSYINATQQLSSFMEKNEEVETPDGAKLKDVIWLTFYNLKTEEQYEQWFKAFQTSGIDIATIENNQGYMLAGISLHRNLLAVNPLEKWPALEDTLRLILKASLAQKLYLIAAYAIRNLIQLIFCTSKDLAKIEKILIEHAEFINLSPIYKFLVYDELGHQYSYAGHNDQALIELSKVADVEVPETYTESVTFLIAYADLISSKSQLTAHAYIVKALERTLNSEYYTPIEQIKLYGEVGISYFLIGKPYESIKSLEKSFDMLLNAYDNSDDFKATIVRNGHNANYISQVILHGAPPEETSDGEIYAPPTRRSFFFSDEKLLKGGFYFEQRRYINCIIYQSTNEHYGDYPDSKKWALKSIEIALKLNSAEYASLLYRNLFYIVMDRDYNKAINLYNEIKQAYIAAENEPIITSRLPERPPGLVDFSKSDYSFFEEVLIPIVYQVAQDIVNGAIGPEDYPQIISDLFDNPNIHVTDTDTLDFIKILFEKVLLNEITRHDFQTLLATYKGASEDQVITVAYILYAFQSSAIAAAEMHLILMTRIEKIHSKNFVGFYKYMIVPFFESFWVKKFETHKKEFSDNDFWLNKSLPSFQKVDSSQKLRKLFRTLRHHLPLKTTTTQDDWIDS